MKSQNKNLLDSGHVLRILSSFAQDAIPCSESIFSFEDVVDQLILELRKRDLWQGMYM